jgi:signal transduction histidine kinase
MDDASDRTRAYVADVAHDLQSPLTGMRTQLEVALARSDTPSRREWVRSMLAATTEMELLVSDLLALASEERSDHPVPDELVDLDDLVRTEAQRPRPATDVGIDLSAVEALKVRGDERSLRRLVRNLLDNALRHASSQVRLSLRDGGDAVVLDVVDDGPGVPEEHRERIFDRFYRVGPSDRLGTGLGLAIVRQVAERHGGRVAMLPGAPGEGAHVRVHLPVPG